jgi:hypothetical protein
LTIWYKWFVGVNLKKSHRLNLIHALRDAFEISKIKYNNKKYLLYKNYLLAAHAELSWIAKETTWSSGFSWRSVHTSDFLLRFFLCERCGRVDLLGMYISFLERINLFIRNCRALKLAYLCRTYFNLFTHMCNRLMTKQTSKCQC